MIRVVDLDVGKIANGLPVWQGFQSLSADPDDKEPFEGDVFQPLGIASLPYQQDDDGGAEAVAVEGTGGMQTAYIGGRDVRCAGIYGALEPGDFAAFAPHPNQACQVLLKGEKRIASLITKDKNDEIAMVTIDGENEELQIMAFGGMLHYSKAGGWRLADKDGAGFTVGGGIITIYGKIMLSGPASKLPVRIGVAPTGGAPSPTVFAMVGRAWARLELWVWSHLPREDFA